MVLNFFRAHLNCIYENNREVSQSVVAGIPDRIVRISFCRKHFRDAFFYETETTFFSIREPDKHIEAMESDSFSSVR